MTVLPVYLPSALFGFGAACAAFDLWRGMLPARVAGFSALVLGVVLRLAGFMDGSCPVTTTSGGIGLVAFLLAIHLAVGFHFTGAERVKTAALFLAVFVLDLLARAFGTGAVHPRPPASDRAWAELHGGLVFLAYAAFLVGALYCAFYLVLHRLMKRRRLGFWFSRMPSLQRLEQRAARADLVGFVALTLGLGVGVFWLATRRGTLPWNDLKIVGAAAAWVVFACDLVLRRVLRWRGVRVAVLPLVGLLLLSAQLAVSATDHPFWSSP